MCDKGNIFSVLNFPPVSFSDRSLVPVLWDRENKCALYHCSAPCRIAWTSILPFFICPVSKVPIPISASSPHSRYFHPWFFLSPFSDLPELCATLCAMRGPVLPTGSIPFSALFCTSFLVHPFACSCALSRGLHCCLQWHPAPCPLQCSLLCIY